MGDLVHLHVAGLRWQRRNNNNNNNGLVGFCLMFEMISKWKYDKFEQKSARF